MDRFRPNNRTFDKLVVARGSKAGGIWCKVAENTQLILILLLRGRFIANGPHAWVIGSQRKCCPEKAGVEGRYTEAA